MFGGSLFRQFDNDPFFSDFHSRHMQHMQQMEQMMDPFFGSAQSQLPSIQDRQDMGTDRHRNGGRSSGANQLMPFGGGLFGGFGNMFNEPRNMMQRMGQMQDRMQSDPNSHCFSSSTVMSYSNTGNGQPKMYQASTSTRTAPGGVRETRKQVRDSESGVDKMAVGHHIHDRGHVVARSRNRRTGDRNEDQEFLNLEEDELDHFNHEWHEKTSRFNTEQAAIRDRMRRPQHDRRAIADSKHRSRGYRDRGNRE